MCKLDFIDLKSILNKIMETNRQFSTRVWCKKEGTTILNIIRVLD